MTKTTPYLVRRATSSDVDCITTYVMAMALESETLVLSRITVEQGVQAVLEHPEKGQYWLIETEHRVCGLAMSTVEWSDWHNQEYWWIQSVWIEPEHRGSQGALTPLMAAISEAAKIVGVVELRLYVAEDNHAAQKAYRKRGFVKSHYQVMRQSLSIEGNARGDIVNFIMNE
jgi:ribosomal protein S18 acetylase RimI-like enzyme